MEAFEECDEIIQQIESGERVPRFNSVEDLMADLMSEDDDGVAKWINERILSSIFVPAGTEAPSRTHCTSPAGV